MGHWIGPAFQPGWQLPFDLGRDAGVARELPIGVPAGRHFQEEPGRERLARNNSCRVGEKLRFDQLAATEFLARATAGAARSDELPEAARQQMNATQAIQLITIAARERQRSAICPGTRQARVRHSVIPIRRSTERLQLQCAARRRVLQFRGQFGCASVQALFSVYATRDDKCLVSTSLLPAERGEANLRSTLPPRSSRPLLPLAIDLFGAFLNGDPLPAVGVVAGVATRVIRDHVVDEILVVRQRRADGPDPARSKMNRPRSPRSMPPWSRTFPFPETTT